MVIYDKQIMGVKTCDNSCMLGIVNNTKNGDCGLLTSSSSNSSFSNIRSLHHFESHNYVILLLCVLFLFL